MIDKSINIVGLEILNCFLILRWYVPERRGWGFRNLGGSRWYPRVALDLGPVSIIFERYWS